MSDTETTQSIREWREKRLGPRTALCDWWLYESNLGMSPNEMAQSIISSLDRAGFEIVRKNSGEAATPDRD